MNARIDKFAEQRQREDPVNKYEGWIKQSNELRKRVDSFCHCHHAGILMMQVRELDEVVAGTNEGLYANEDIAAVMGNGV